jgi:ABC-2 type transport system ATP-binding protein
MPVLPPHGTRGPSGRHDAETAIDVRGLTRRFGSFVAVDDLSFDVARGEIFGFLGANGAGKSTTIRMLCGLLRPSSGTAMVGGIDVARDPEGVKRRIGYMSQRFSLYELLTVDQNIRFFGGIYGLTPARLAERERSCSRWPGCHGREQTLARDLAGGWRQRLALGCAILHEPRILFLDEPTGGVDPISRRQFWRLIESLSAGGVTVLVTTHYLDEAERCHRVALIHAGRLAVIGTTTRSSGSSPAARSWRSARIGPSTRCALLDAMPEVEKTSLFGTRVHAVLRTTPWRPRIWPAGCGRAAFLALSAERVLPSLEDVFLDVVDRAGQGSAQLREVSPERLTRRGPGRRPEGAAPDLARSAHAAHPRVHPGVLPAALRLRPQLRHPQRAARGGGSRRHAAEPRGRGRLHPFGLLRADARRPLAGGGRAAAGPRRGARRADDPRGLRP